MLDLGSTSAASLAKLTHAALALRCTVAPLSLSWLDFAQLGLSA